jgi:hypothetical protein
VVCSRARDFDGAVQAQKKVITLIPPAPRGDPLAGGEEAEAKRRLKEYEQQNDRGGVHEPFTPHMSAFLMLRRSVLVVGD